jgi:hypothetical protein
MFQQIYDHQLKKATKHNFTIKTPKIMTRHPQSYKRTKISIKLGKQRTVLYIRPTEHCNDK